MPWGVFFFGVGFFGSIDEAGVRILIWKRQIALLLLLPPPREEVGGTRGGGEVEKGRKRLVVVGLPSPEKQNSTSKPSYQVDDPLFEQEGRQVRCGFPSVGSKLRDDL